LNGVLLSNVSSFLSNHALFPSINPSLSTVPSAIPSSSSKPSIEPSSSSQHSLSLRNSANLARSEPTWSPTISNSLTATPTEEIDFVGNDEYGRRYFPQIPFISDKTHSYYQVPNCTSAEDNPGCVFIQKLRKNLFQIGLSLRPFRR